MEKLADPDTSFLVPCARCDALLAEGERFCPLCGKDQTADVPAARPPLPASADGMPETDQGVGWLRAREAGLRGVRDVPAMPQAREGGRRIGRGGTAVVVLGIVAALVLGAAALLWGAGHDGGPRDEADRQRAFDAGIAQLQGALDRSDLAGAERAFAALDATQAADPTAAALKQRLDQRLREQAQRREQLSSAARDASQSLGFGQATTQTPAPPAPAAPAPKDCNEALLALALCQPQ